MAKRGIPLNPGYRPGSHWADCWSCGFQFRAEDLIETWDHQWVCDEDWEKRHEQDFLRVKPEIITVDEPLLKGNTDTVQVQTTLGGVTTSAATFGTTSAVAGTAEAGRAICGTRVIPLATFGNINALTNPST